MSEEQQFGQAGIEADQGYFPIGPDTSKPPAPDAEPPLAESIDNWASHRDRENIARPPVERAYQKTDGPDRGERYDEKGTVPLDRAAKDIAEARELDEALVEFERNQKLAEEIDTARGLRPDLLADAHQPQDQQPVQPEQQQQSAPTESADDEVARVLQQNPRVLSALQQHHAASAAQVDQAISSAAQWAQTNAELAAAAILVRPELQGVHPSQIPGALQALATANPEAARQIQQQLNHAQTLTQQAAEARNVASQRASIQFQQFGKASDDAFERSMAGESPETVRAIRETAMQMMRETGLSDADLAYQWNSNGLLRSVHGQTLLADAARWRMMKADMANKVARPTPNVQRPGSSVDRGDATDRDSFALENRYRGPLTVKEATALTLGRRARAR